MSPTTLLFHDRSLSADTQSIRFSIARVKRSNQAPFMKLSKQSAGNGDAIFSKAMPREAGASVKNQVACRASQRSSTSMNLATSSASCSVNNGRAGAPSSLTNPKNGWALMAPPVPLIPRSALTAVLTAEFPDVSENGARRRTETMKADARFVHAGPHS